MIRQQDATLILHRLGEQDKQLRAIHEEVVRTNGRVSKLERWQAFMEGGLAILAILVVPMVIYLLSLGGFVVAADAAPQAPQQNVDTA